ncbi:hypothetical protein GGX14DRAFT_402149 [Mycena pura]|uniref:Uncharacterized protein n=1 Tax=Mycena pura TaxID=153505 RepID=A0AAD6V5Y3_9AGAR|nr:hypothetical protein GGX14DRAFT_402149 [Mycena pura]
MRKRVRGRDNTAKNAKKCEKNAKKKKTLRAVRTSALVWAGPVRTLDGWVWENFGSNFDSDFRGSCGGKATKPKKRPKRGTGAGDGQEDGNGKQKEVSMSVSWIWVTQESRVDWRKASGGEHDPVGDGASSYKRRVMLHPDAEFRRSCRILMQSSGDPGCTVCDASTGAESGRVVYKPNIFFPFFHRPWIDYFPGPRLYIPPSVALMD